MMITYVKYILYHKASIRFFLYKNIVTHQSPYMFLRFIYLELKTLKVLITCS